MINNSVMKCIICNNKKSGEFIIINDKKYHLYCIEQLQQENQSLKEENESLIKYKEEHIYILQENQSLKDRIEKAIECVENNMQYDDNIDDCWTTTNDLLELLKGDVE